MAKEKIEEPKVEEPKVEVAKEEPKEEQKILVSISDLEGFKKELADIKRQNAMLLEVADKRNLENYFSRHKENRKPIVRVRTIDGKIIVGWENMTKNDVYKDAQTLAWKEEQLVSLLFENGTKETYNLLDFNRRFDYIDYVVIGKEKQDDGTDNYSLISKVGGKELLINSKFIN